MMAVMTAQPPLPLVPDDARPVGAAAAIVEDDDGGRVFVHGNLAYAWDAGDTAGRRFAAVSLVRIKAATQLEVAEAFAVKPATVRRWEARLADAGVAGLLAERKGPKRKSKLTGDTVAAIRRLRDGRGVLPRHRRRHRGVGGQRPQRARPRRGGADAEDAVPGSGLPEPLPSPSRRGRRLSKECVQQRFPMMRQRPVPVLGAVPVLADPVDRGAERVLARFGLIASAPPVFTPCARAPLAGLLLALPALAGDRAARDRARRLRRVAQRVLLAGCDVVRGRVSCPAG